MNKKAAKEKAREIVYALIDSYFGVGQPYEDHEEKDADKIYQELLLIQQRYL